MYRIPILEGHDPTDYFWFMPVRVTHKPNIKWEDVDELGDEVSIEEPFVECFLVHFFRKHFNENLKENYCRHDAFGFSWYLEHNFYTYECMEEMLKDIEHAADLLETDYDSPELNDVKKDFEYNWMTDTEDYIAYDPEEEAALIRDNIRIVSDFYRRFVSRMREMMSKYPEANLISIMGP